MSNASDRFKSFQSAFVKGVGALGVALTDSPTRALGFASFAGITGPIMRPIPTKGPPIMNDYSELIFFAFSIAFVSVIIAIPVVITLTVLRVVKKSGRFLFTTKRRLVRK